MAAIRNPTPALPELDAIRHKETRKNIPIEELREFVADGEVKPRTMLYLRDPSLDPQRTSRNTCREAAARHPQHVLVHRGAEAATHALVPGKRGWPQGHSCPCD